MGKKKLYEECGTVVYAVRVKETVAGDIEKLMQAHGWDGAAARRAIVEAGIDSLLRRDMSKRAAAGARRGSKPPDKETA